jgi:hypothetical protein
MTADDFAEHIARVRRRFASTINDKIGAVAAALKHMINGDAAVENVIAAHRTLHEMYGIAPTIGFAATGKAAGLARTTIREAAKTKRAPTPAEIAALKSELEGLRAAAAADLAHFSTEAPRDVS